MKKQHCVEFREAFICMLAIAAAKLNHSAGKIDESLPTRQMRQEPGETDNEPTVPSLEVWTSNMTPPPSARAQRPNANDSMKPAQIVQVMWACTMHDKESSGTGSKGFVGVCMS